MSKRSALDVVREAARQQQANEARLAEGTAAVPNEIRHLPRHILMGVPHAKLLQQTPMFECPGWAGFPSYSEAHFSVTKSGAPIGEARLNKHPFYLFGQGSSCDYRLENPSISRTHAAVVFNPNQKKYVLVDLSTNGCKVNGSRVKKGENVTLEWGDTVLFGTSERAYVLRKEKAPPQRLHKSEKLTVEEPVNTAPAAAATTGPIATEAKPAAAAPPVQQQKPAEPPAPVEPAKPLARHFRQILIKHNAVANPVSKAPRNKGEPITRSLDDAIALANTLRSTPDVTVEAKFVELCGAFSEEAGAKRGGDLGVVNQGDFMPEWDLAAFALGPSSISMPFQTDLGVHLVYRVAEDELQLE